MASSSTKPADAPAAIPDREELAPLKRAMSITGLAKSTIYRDMRDGKFPKPVYRGRKPLWPVSRLHALVRQIITESEGEADSSAEEVGTE